MTFKVSPQVAEKLRDKHNVTGREIAECFANRAGPYFSDSREDNKTDPPTYWFVSETDRGRTLKVIFVRYPDHFAIKSAYEPTDGSDTFYAELCGRMK